MNVRPWLVGGALSLGLSLVGSLPVAAHPVTYGGTLSNLGEPPQAASSLGTGSIIVIFDDDDFTMNVHVDFSNLQGTTTASHIHCCTPSPGTGSAGVATPVPTFPGFPLTVQAGVYDQTFDMALASSWNPAYVTANGGTTASAFAALATGIASGRAYLNIHSTQSTGGEIRAFLSPVPLPASVLLLTSGLAGFARLFRGRRGLSDANEPTAA